MEKTESRLSSVIDNVKHPLESEAYRLKCKEPVHEGGVLVLKEWLQPNIIQKILKEAESQEHLAYFCVNNHNVYLEPSDNSFSLNHARNRNIGSSKGCITDNQVPIDSPLRILYNADEFKSFLCFVLGEKSLYKYDDDLSSINIHYANESQNWDGILIIRHSRLLY